MSSITLSVLRGEVGKTFSGWQAQEVTGTFNAPRLVIQCQSCGNRMNVDVNQWYSITQGREWRCSNASGHRAETKAEKRPQPLTLEVLSKMSSDELKRRIMHEPGFEEAANAIYNSGPKQLNYREAQEQKAARDKAAKIAPVHVWWKRLYRVCSGNAGIVPPVPARPMPVQSLQEMAALKPAQLERIITDYNLRENDGMVRF